MSPSDLNRVLRELQASDPKAAASVEALSTRATIRAYLEGYRGADLIDIRRSAIQDSGSVTSDPRTGGAREVEAQLDAWLFPIED